MLEVRGLGSAEVHCEKKENLPRMEHYGISKILLHDNYNGNRLDRI